MAARSAPSVPSHQSQSKPAGLSVPRSSGSEQGLSYQLSRAEPFSVAPRKTMSGLAPPPEGDLHSPTLSDFFIF